MSRAVTGLVLGSLAAAWVALGLALLGGGRQELAVAHGGGAPARDVGLVVAGERAQAAVVAWLSASQEHPEAVEELFGEVPAQQLPEQGAVVANAVVAVQVPRGPGLWSITVGADVTEPGGRPLRRYLQVPVVVDGAGARVRAQVVALPAPVPAPAAGVGAVVGYGGDVETSGPMATTVLAFLTALTTGSGDITRYESPGTAIEVILPPVARGVRLDALQIRDGDDEALVAAPRPAEGGQVRVLATVQLRQTARQARTAVYALTMRARGGRWEVLAIDPTPSVVLRVSPVTPAPEVSGPDPSSSFPQIPVVPTGTTTK